MLKLLSLRSRKYFRIVLWGYYRAKMRCTEFLPTNIQHTWTMAALAFARRSMLDHHTFSPQPPVSSNMASWKIPELNGCFQLQETPLISMVHLVSISQVPYAAFHPIFFLHHSNVDRIYEKHVQMETPEECVPRARLMWKRAGEPMLKIGSQIPGMMFFQVSYNHIQSINHQDSSRIYDTFIHESY